MRTPLVFLIALTSLPCLASPAYFRGAEFNLSHYEGDSAILRLPGSPADGLTMDPGSPARDHAVPAREVLRPIEGSFPSAGGDLKAGRIVRFHPKELGSAQLQSKWELGSVVRIYPNGEVLVTLGEFEVCVGLAYDAFCRAEFQNAKDLVVDREADEYHRLRRERLRRERLHTQPSGTFDTMY
jgi:hypothetical protein